MKLGFIVCGALGREVQAIVRKHRWDARVVGVAPVDHMYPQRIAADVESRIRKIGDRVDRLAVVYGDCGSKGALDEVLDRHDIRRVDARNCYEMFAGPAYGEFVEEELGTFFLTDFLVRSFHRAVVQGLGLDRFPELKEAYFHNCTRIVYLVQNESAELRDRAQMIADYMELPLKVHHTGYAQLEKCLLELVNREDHRFGLPSWRTCNCGNKGIG